MLTVLKAASLAAVVSIGLVCGQATTSQAATYRYDIVNADGSGDVLGFLHLPTLSDGIASGCGGNAALNCPGIDFEYTDPNIVPGLGSFDEDDITKIYWSIDPTTHELTIPFTISDHFSMFNGSFSLFSNGGGVGTTIFNNLTQVNWVPAPVPLPAAAWFLLSALGGLGFAGWRRRKAIA